MTSAAQASPRRELDLLQWSDLLDEVARLHRSGYRRLRLWDLGQICVHVSEPIVFCLDGFAATWPSPIRLIAPWVRRRLFRTRRIPEGIRKPRILRSPPPGHDDRGVQALTDAVERFERHAGPFHIHPLFGRFTRQEWIDFHLIHAAHHLSCLMPIPSPSAPEGDNTRR